MGPDERLSSIDNFMMIPINEDGSYGEPIRLDGVKCIHDFDISTDESSEPAAYKCIPNFINSFSEIVFAPLPHKRMSKKTFKKWLMANGFERNFAEFFCRIIVGFHGRISYQSIYFESFLTPTPNTVLNNILFEGERTYERRSKKR